MSMWDWSVIFKVLVLRCTTVNSAIDQFENAGFAEKAVQQAIVPGFLSRHDPEF